MRVLVDMGATVIGWDDAPFARETALREGFMIADPTPIPIPAYLGSGSDKMIGNAEADTCYSQGSRRNRLTGLGVPTPPLRRRGK